MTDTHPQIALDIGPIETIQRSSSDFTIGPVIGTHGTIDLIERRGDTIAYICTRPINTRAERNAVRRAAIQWMSTNPKLQRNIRRYRFDLVIAGARTPDAF